MRYLSSEQARYVASFSAKARVWKPERRNQAVRLRREGYSWDKISYLMKASKRSIIKVCREAGV